MIRFSMSFRLGLVIAATSMAVAALILFSLVIFSKKINQDLVQAGQQQIEHAVSAQLIRDARVLAATLSDNLTKPLYNFDFSAMKQVIEELANSGELDYVYIYDLNYRVVHDGSAELVSFGALLSSQDKVKLVPNGQSQAKHIAQIVHVTEPIESKGVVFGGISFGLKFSKAEQDILRYQQDIKKYNDAISEQYRLFFILLAVFVLLLIVPIAYFSSRSLTRPLSHLVRNSHEIIKHGGNIVFSHHRDDEVGQLADALNEMTARLNTSHQQMTRIAYQDELTNLSNRRHFNLELIKLREWASNEQCCFALLLIDLDKFKQVNDTAGHDVGDLLLQLMAKRLSQQANDFSMQHTGLEQHCLVARLGGDEFVVALPYVGCDSVVTDFAQQLNQSMQQPMNLKGSNIKASLSIGISLYPLHGKDITELLKDADLAMYEAKKAGGGAVQQFNFSMREEYRLNYVIRNELQSALENNQLYIDYQPFYSVDQSHFIGAEALIRWQHPEYGLIMPEQFVELLEGSELIHQLTLWVVQKVLQDSDTLAQLGINHLLSINISSSCVADNRVCQDIAKLLKDNQNELQTIGLELTETGMMSDFEQCRRAMSLWKEQGAQIWIDDFGTGYSSLSYLHELAIDVLKVDRSFIASLKPDVANPVVMSIFALAKALGIEVIAEGIEQEQQAQAVVALGADILQGFMLAKPMSLKDFIQKMELSDHVQI